MENNPAATNALNIHCFLIANPLLLSKRFVFFDQNLDQQHWILSCFYNPWFYILKKRKNQSTINMPEFLVSYNKKCFVHGILMFDPMEGFLEQDKLTPQLNLYCNVYVWFMNMASWYSDALYEDRLKYLDFFMSFHLQKSKKNKLQDRFQADDEFWEGMKLIENEETYKDIPP